jgi:Uma2 family endonuclease
MSDATQVTLEEFLKNPDIHYYDFHELHNGEVVAVSPPSEAHIEMQQRLQSLLHGLLSGAGYDVRREFYYTVESNSRRADVAVIRKARRDVGSSKAFRGGPDLLKRHTLAEQYGNGSR